MGASSAGLHQSIALRERCWRGTRHAHRAEVTRRSAVASAGTGAAWLPAAGVRTFCAACYPWHRGRPGPDACLPCNRCRSGRLTGSAPKSRAPAPPRNHAVKFCIPWSARPQRAAGWCSATWPSRPRRAPRTLLPALKVNEGVDASRASVHLGGDERFLPDVVGAVAGGHNSAPGPPDRSLKQAHAEHALVPTAADHRSRQRPSKKRTVRTVPVADSSREEILNRRSPPHLLVQ